VTRRRLFLASFSDSPFLRFLFSAPDAYGASRHNSLPCTPLSAAKYSTPLTLVREEGSELPLPDQTSLTRTVPAAVPLLRHNSLPVTPLFAAKYTTFPMPTNSLGEELCRTMLISLTNAGCAPTGGIQMTEMRRECGNVQVASGPPESTVNKVKVASRDPS
jgi:hypothetical protein